MRPVEKRITENYRTLAEIKERTDTPSETVEKAIETFGDLRPVAEAIATAVNLKTWDGRISDKNKSWAKSYTENGRKTYTEDRSPYLITECEYMEGIDRIHPAHLDQLADLIRKECEAPTEPQKAPSEPQEETTPIKALRTALEATPTRSAWSRGVKSYALELLEYEDEDLLFSLSLKPTNGLKREVIRKALLNGARNWNEYSWGGCSLIYDEDIAKRLCTPSELKKTHNGQRDPNEREQWLDTQARALYQAEHLIFRTLERLGLLEV